MRTEAQSRVYDFPTSTLTDYESVNELHVVPNGPVIIDPCNLPTAGTRPLGRASCTHLAFDETAALMSTVDEWLSRVWSSERSLWDDVLHEIDFEPVGFTTRRVSVRIRERRQAPVSGALTEDDFALIADD